MSLQTYQQFIFDTVQYIADNVIRPIDANSSIETRYITSEGQGDENWIGFLRNGAGVVDIWLITVAGLSKRTGAEGGGVGFFLKPLTVYIDYFADYRQGLDYNQTSGATNSEYEFLKKVFAFDYAMEISKQCLGDSSRTIISYDIRIALKKFVSDTTHRASIVLNLQLDIQN